MSRSLSAAEAAAILATPVKARGGGNKTDFSIRTAKNWFSLEHIFDEECAIELHDEDEKPRKPILVVLMPNGILCCRRCFLGKLDE